MLDNQMLTKDELDFIEEVMVEHFRGIFEGVGESFKEMRPYITGIWKELHGDKKPSTLAEGLAMAEETRNEYYKRKKRGEL